MPDQTVDQLRAKVAASIAEQTQAETAYSRAVADVRAAELQLDTLQRRGTDRDGQNAEETLRSERRRMATAAGRLAVATADVKDSRTAYHAAVGETGAFTSLDAGTPLLLMPVRIETKFLDVDGESPELCVRVWPDDCAVDSWERMLDSTEREWGRIYWETAWRAGRADEASRRRAWSQLEARFTAARAAWIVKATTPTNLSAWPSGPQPKDRPMTPAPILPPLVVTGGAGSHQPQSNVLPDHWLVLGYRIAEGPVHRGPSYQQVLSARGNLIPHPLVLWPRQAAEDGSDDPFRAQGLNWMTDLAEAEAAGMAVRVRLTDVDVEMGFDLLLVVGVKSSLGPIESAAILADLLDAHHYTWGLSVVPQGTPTNRLSSAYYSASQVDSYAVELGPPLCKDLGSAYVANFTSAVTDGLPEDWRNGSLLSAALGVPATVFEHVAHSGEREDRDAFHMNTVLWPTIEYNLVQMLSPHFPDEAIALARRQFIRYVRGRGPLPTLRMGSQPYGVLPVTSYPNLAGSTADHTAPSGWDTAAMRFLLQLQRWWLACLPNVPHVGAEYNPDDAGGGPPSAEWKLARILGMTAQAERYTVRWLKGAHLIANEERVTATGRFPNDLDRQSKYLEDMHHWLQAQGDAARAPGVALGLDWQPYLARMVYGEGFPFSAPLAEIRADEFGGLPGLEGGSNFIHWLRRASIEDIRREAPWSQIDAPRPASLLYLVLRHATLLELWNCAFQINMQRKLEALDPRPGPVDTRGMLIRRLRAERIDTQIVDLPDGTETPNVYRLMASLSGDRTLGEEIDALRQDAEHIPKELAIPMSELLAFDRSLSNLAEQSVSSLAQQLLSTLDLAANRLDAWMTSFATRRLHEIRSGAVVGGGRAYRPGIHLAAYSWVEGVKPRRTSPPPRPPLAGERPLHPLQPDNLGFVHAPSVPHAETAAVLRAGYWSYQDHEESDRMAVDLSSRRVRLALRLIDGVRQGQPLGLLLGYRFERRMHESVRTFGVLLDQYVDAFRSLTPIRAGKLVETGDTPAANATNNVVDGLALLRRWEAGRRKEGRPNPLWHKDTIPFGQQGLPAATSDAFDAVNEILASLADELDALSDVMVAEGVFQLVRGNAERSAAAMGAMSEPELPLPEPEVVRSTRGGTALTHRLAVLFSGAIGQPRARLATWNQGHRGLAEPHLNAWAADMLGDPAKVVFMVEYLDPDSNPDAPVPLAEVPVQRMALKELKLCPLDVVYGGLPGVRAQWSELEQRCAAHALTNLPSLPGVPGEKRDRLRDVRLTFARVTVHVGSERTGSREGAGRPAT